MDQEQAGLGLTIENVYEGFGEVIAKDVSLRGADSMLIRIFSAVAEALDPDDSARTRVVFTGDFVQSVNVRDKRDQPFTMARGSGIVAAKTMPPNGDGIVHILIPAFWLAPIEDADEEADAFRIVGHLAAHEAVHAALHHLGTEPFDVYKRKTFGYATTQFVAMAAEQAEEHLAEYLSNQVVTSSDSTNDSQVVAAFDAFTKTLEVELPALDDEDPDYFDKGMRVTFEALHILWKALAYLAAEIRHGDKFNAVPSAISALPVWKASVQPWWGDYTALLARIPMSVEVNVANTDAVVVELGAHLQKWGYGLGFDFRDKGEGGFFRIMLWD